MASTEALSHEAAADDHHHGEHPAFLAHHFDTPEQQFDSGKLGMWLFLVTEVLFFSGLFCAYAIYRAMRPEVFEGCSVFLNTQLGALNTVVLLFSSLTMAWAVRCAQLEQHKMLTGMLAATLACASFFLGIKAIEYSHKIDLGLLPAGMYSYDPSASQHHEGLSHSLMWMSAPFAVAAVGLLIWFLVAKVRKSGFQTQIAGPLFVAAAFFFVGVGVASAIESGGAEVHAEEPVMEAGGLVIGEEHAASSAEGVPVAEDPAGIENIAGAEAEGAGAAVEESPSVADDAGLIGHLAQQETNTGVRQQIQARERQAEMASGRIVTSAEQVTGPVSEAVLAINSPYLAGVFFSIYYCMTGLHAIHILAGMGVLTWLIVRSARRDFNRQYFGPVDYVGLYWHIVDLIWIYLFPLLYLIR